MGYKLPARTARLTFEGTDYDGAEVVISLKAPLRLYLDAARLREEKDTDAILEFAAKFLLSWNLEDDDGEIPATLEGIWRLDDTGFIFALLDAWEKAIGGTTKVDAPLDEQSNSRDASLEAGIATVPL